MNANRTRTGQIRRWMRLRDIFERVTFQWPDPTSASCVQGQRTDSATCHDVQKSHGSGAQHHVAGLHISFSGPAYGFSTCWTPYVSCLVCPVCLELIVSLRIMYSNYEHEIGVSPKPRIPSINLDMPWSPCDQLSETDHSRYLNLCWMSGHCKTPPLNACSALTGHRSDSWAAQSRHRHTFTTNICLGQSGCTYRRDVPTFSEISISCWPCAKRDDPYKSVIAVVGSRVEPAIWWDLKFTEFLNDRLKFDESFAQQQISVKR